jgi:hypothetical protein
VRSDCACVDVKEREIVEERLELLIVHELLKEPQMVR